MNTITDTVNRELLKFAVQRNIFCRISGEVLDIRTAVLITGTKDGANVVNLCVTGEVFDNGRDDMIATATENGVTLEIIDGRAL